MRNNAFARIDHRPYAGVAGSPSRPFAADEAAETAPLAQRSLAEIATAKTWTVSEIVVMMVGLTEGLVHLANLAINYLFKDDLDLSPSQVSLLFVAPSFPWFLKPLFAFYSDSYPLFGMRRKPYLVFFSAMQCVGYLSLATSKSLLAAVLALFLIAFSAAFCSAISEALLVESSESSSDPTRSTTAVSQFTLARALGSMVVAYSSGALLESVSKQTVFIVTALFPLAITMTAMLIDDSSSSPNVTVSDQFAVLLRFITQKVIWGPALFVLVFMCGPDYDDALFFYFTNVLKFGPSFMGSLKLTYGIAATAGILMYQYSLTKTPYRTLLIATILISLPIYWSPILLVTGWNLRLGISDKVFVLSGGFLNEAIAEIQMMPLLCLVASICPPGIEGSAYSTLYAVRSLGSSLSKGSSAIGMLLLGITASNFKRLPLYIFICGCFNLAALLFLRCIPSNVEIEHARKMKGSLS